MNLPLLERPKLGWRGALPPGRVPLTGATASLLPLDPRRDAPALYDAAHTAPTDPELWAYLPYGPFADAEDYGRWLWGQAARLDPVFYTIVPRGQPAAGLASYLRLDPANGVIEIGHLLFTPRLQRTIAATEALALLLAYAFDDLGHRRVEWKCDAANARSRRSAERLGFTFEGVFRQAAVVRDRNRDTAWYAIVDGDWPAVKAGFDAWLHPSNHDPAGRQRRSLATCRKDP
ncbi:MAG: GNAT family protein [Pseudomonadota bacterium]